MRYSPQIIKIDRYLITEIQNDRNKQIFDTVEYARMNGIKVLAEGVETAENSNASSNWALTLSGLLHGKASRRTA